MMKNVPLQAINGFLAAILVFGSVYDSAAQSADGTRARMIGGAVPSPAPTPTPTPAPSPTPPKLNVEEGIIRVETELVNLNVRVIDRNNRPIRNLKESDFIIFEDNVRQEIGFFSQSEVPTNYSLVVDNSGSLRNQIEKVIEAGKILISGNRAFDQTSVIRFVSSDKIEITQDFTDQKQYLFDALDDMYIEGGQTAIIDAVYLAAQRIGEYEKSTDAADRKRRALVLVTDGEDRVSFYTQKMLFDMLREIDVQIFVVGFVDELSPSGGFIGKSDQSKAKSFLTKLADETGGKAYFPMSVTELSSIAADIGSEMRTQYSIGYIPSNDRKDGTYRNIRVSVKDGPGSQKRIAIARTGRIAEPTEGAPSLKTDNNNPKK